MQDPYQTLPTVKKHVACNKVRSSKAQRAGVSYTSASGGQIPNVGEAAAKHTDHEGNDFEFVFLHARVMFPILSISHFVTKECSAFFKRSDGVVKYPDGRRRPFTTKYCGFFVLLNTNLGPDKPDASTFDASVSKQGFSRQG